MASSATQGLAALLILSAVSGASAATPIWPPLPPVRPPELRQGQTAPAPVPAPPQAAAPAAAPAAPTNADACLADLKADRVEAEPASAPPAPGAQCGVAASVRLKSIGLTNGAAIDLPARPMLDCPFAKVFAGFVRDLVAPLSQATLGASVVALDTGPGYDCRPQDHVPGANISPHGTGIAIDVAGFVLADKRRLNVGHDAGPREAAFMQTIRRAGCGWFTTILGPGDPDHAEHFHFDIKQHGSSENYRICQ